MSNNTNNWNVSLDNSTDTESLLQTDTIPFATLGANFIVCVMILVNNILLLVTLAKTRQLWTLTNAYIASLSVADLLIGIVLVVRHFWLIPSTEWVFDHHEYVCVPIICLLYVSGLESLGCLTLVSADRYLYIVHPYWYERNITSRVTGILIASTWALSITLGFLPMRFNNFSPDEGCQPMSMISKYYLMGCLTSYFFVAATVITVMYSRVFCVGNKHRRRIEAAAPAPMSATNQGKKEKSFWQVIRFLLMVCGLFFLCWLPLTITVYVYFTVGAPVLAISITVSISGINSALNFYALLSMNRTFRTALAKLVCCCRRHTKDSSTTTSGTMDAKNGGARACNNNMPSEQALCDYTTRNNEMSNTDTKTGADNGSL